MSILSDIETAVFKPQRQFGQFTQQVTIEELGHDELVITEHPVEQGASVTDHAYKKPVELIVRMAFSNNSIAALGGDLQSIAQLVNGDNAGDFNYMQRIYTQFQQLQQSRVPFNITTGKRKYSNMLIKSLTCPTDKNTEHALFITAVCKEVILVSTQATSLPDPSVMANPAQNAPVQNTGVLQPSITAFTLLPDSWTVGPPTSLH